MLSLNIAGRLIDFDEPRVMGIINVTPDSFYSGSRTPEEASVLLRRAASMVEQGAAILDIGACSTRPGFTPVPVDEEMRRLDFALTALAPLRDSTPGLIISIDTFRAEVARHCAVNYGVHIINDISAGQYDPAMYTTVADLHLPYVLTHNPIDLRTVAPGDAPAESSFLPSVARFFADHLSRLHAFGVADVILDPGFGFGKTLQENYLLLHHLADFVRLFPDNPFLIGLSRKSMIYKLLGSSPEEALNGTTALHAIALQAGGHILRVHDVRPAVETIRIHQFLKLNS